MLLATRSDGLHLIVSLLLVIVASCGEQLSQVSRACLVEGSKDRGDFG